MHDKFAIHSRFNFRGWKIHFGNGTTIPETSVQINSTGHPVKVTQDWTKAFITQHRQTRTVWPDNGGAPYTELVPPCPNDASISGMVDMTTYGAWLATIGVQIASTNPTPTQQMCQ